VIPLEHLNQHVSTLGTRDLNKLIIFFFFMDDGAFFLNSGELTVQLAQAGCQRIVIVNGFREDGIVRKKCYEGTCAICIAN